jgi:hypothetical protein
MLTEIKEHIRNFGFMATTYGRFRDRIFTGHVRIGPVTFFGANAMHYAVVIRTDDGYICFRPTTHDGDWPWYFYVSPDGTPGCAWWGTGPGFQDDDEHTRQERRKGKQFALYMLRQRMNELNARHEGSLIAGLELACSVLEEVL